MARRFDANGVPTGRLVQVANGTFKESDPDVAMDAQGDFVVSYTRDTNNNNPDSSPSSTTATDQLLNVINVANRLPGRGPFQRRDQRSDGRFDVAWEQTFSATDHDIFLARYSATASSSGTTWSPSARFNDQSPSVSVDDFGNAVVAWEQAGDILARRVSAVRSLGAELKIASTLEPSSSTVGGAAEGRRRRLRGGLRAFTTASGPCGRGVGVRQQDHDHSTLASSTSAPAVSINGSDDYLLTYTSIPTRATQHPRPARHLFF